MEEVLTSIKKSLVELDPDSKKCNRKNKIKFEGDISCINEELEYKEIDSSKFSFNSVYKNESDYFKNIYIDEFQHRGKKSVDLITLSKFNDELKGRFYFIEVRSKLTCNRWNEIKQKVEDTIKKIEDEDLDYSLDTSLIIIGNECDKNEYNMSTTNKLKKEIEDIEFLDIPLGKVSVYEPNSKIEKELI